MNLAYLLLGMLVMAVVTYLIRLLPMVIFRKKIKNVFIRSFLYYVPYAVLAAMTFPAVFYSTGSEWSAVIGCIAAVVLAFLKQKLLVVALGASGAVLIAQLLGL